MGAKMDDTARESGRGEKRRRRPEHRWEHVLKVDCYKQNHLGELRFQWREPGGRREPWSRLPLVTDLTVWYFYSHRGHSVGHQRLP